jgi:hypothetical protein
MNAGRLKFKAAVLVAVLAFTPLSTEAHPLDFFRKFFCETPLLRQNSPIYPVTVENFPRKLKHKIFNEYHGRMIELNDEQKKKWVETARSIGVLPEMGDPKYAPFNPLDDSLLFGMLANRYGMVETSNFGTYRGLGEYLRELSLPSLNTGEIISLEEQMVSLKESSHIFDLGAGEYNFSREYVRMSGRTSFRIPNFTVISLSKEKPLAHPKIHAFEKKYFEDIAAKEITEKFGKTDIIVDLFGAFSYTLNLPLVLERVSEIMKPESYLWIDGPLNWIEVQPGKEIKFTEFLKTIPGFEIIGSDRGVTLVKRTTEEAVIPRLELTKVSASFPPKVWYRVMR